MWSRSWNNGLLMLRIRTGSKDGVAALCNKHIQESRLFEKGVTMLPEQAVVEYQCAGCVNGPYDECFLKSDNSLSCDKHTAGTMMLSLGCLFLGMPKGFDRIGTCKGTRIDIFETFEDGRGFDKFNVPVWKHIDTHGNTIVRGMHPRLNLPFIHIFLCDCRDKIDCYEITKVDQDSMD